MNFRWNDDTVRWYLAADEYTGYSEKLAALIAPMIRGFPTLCDVGCGLGLIDLHLSRHMEKITCVDVSRAAINALTMAAKGKKIGNIEPLLLDSANLDGTWDVILLSFFDSHNIGAYLPRCRKLIAVVGTKNKSELFPRSIQDVQKTYGMRNGRISDSKPPAVHTATRRTGLWTTSSVTHGRGKICHSQVSRHHAGRP